MNPVPVRAVVDASVAVKMFVPEALSAQAQALFASFASQDDAELVVPGLFFIECANVFWKWVQRSGYSAKDARAHMQDLTELGLTIIPVETLAGDALAIALANRITAYDACYIAAAAQVQLPLITADEKLAKQMGRGPYTVQWLADIEGAPSR